MLDKQKLDSFFDEEALAEEGKPNEIIRHTKRVRITKTFLPIVGVFFIGLLLIFPSLKNEIDELKFDITKPKKGEMEKLHIENTVFYITDANNKISKFDTPHIDEIEENSKIVKLAEPKGKITTKNDSWIDVKSDVGFFDQESEQLNLKEKITLFFSEGMDIETSDATFDFKKGTAEGKQKIVGDGYLGKLNAQGFEYINDTKTLILKGKTNILLNEGNFKEKKK
ncbi:MAG: LPS export ABC transporter periplasmic protein LptC [Alphaproteobacteria bacterium]